MDFTLHVVLGLILVTIGICPQASSRRFPRQLSQIQINASLNATKNSTEVINNRDLNKIVKTDDDSKNAYKENATQTNVIEKPKDVEKKDENIRGRSIETTSNSTIEIIDNRDINKIQKTEEEAAKSTSKEQTVEAEDLSDKNTVKKQASDEEKFDINKYISDEFQNKNNVFKFGPSSDNNEEFFGQGFDDLYSSTPISKIPMHLEELTTPKSPIFDQKYKETVDGVQQHLENPSFEEESEEDSKEIDLDEPIFDPKKNQTKLHYKELKQVLKNNTANKNGIHENVDVEEVKQIKLENFFNETKTYDTTEKLPESEEDSGEFTTTRIVQPSTTRKSVEFTKPTINKNNSHLLSNKIERENIKAVNTATSTALPMSTSTEKTKETTTIATTSTTKEQSVQENKVIAVSVTSPRNPKEGDTTTFKAGTTPVEYTTKDAFVTTTEGFDLTTIGEPSTTELSTITTTEDTTTETRTTTQTEETTTAQREEITTTPAEITSTEIQTTENSLRTSKKMNAEPSTFKQSTTEATTFKQSTTEATNFKPSTTEATTFKHSTTEATTFKHSTAEATTEAITHDIINFTFDIQGDQTTSPKLPTTTQTLPTETTTTFAPTTTEVATTVPLVTTTEEDVASTKVVTTESQKVTTIEEATTTELPFEHKKKLDVSHTTMESETLKPSYTLSDVVNPRQNHSSGSTSSSTTEEETTTEDTTSHFPPTEDGLINDNDGNSGKIAAIAISSVGAVCLIILALLLYVMRKRQKRFNYGQRCRPVTLDDYSMDNVSVYNSMRRKAQRLSKRSYGNPAFEDPVVSHPLNFPALSKFANNFEDIKAEYDEIPQIVARTSELPEGCDEKNRYANVIPLPETRVYLTLIENYPNSDYINANYVTGPKDAKGYYIATQGPLQNTVDDFWRMVWEQQTKVILMITHLFENGVEKCADYLPPSEVSDCHRLFGDFQVTLKKREAKEKYIISSIQLKNMVSNSWREVTHFWYLGWPEKGVPNEANSLIAFLIEARSYMKSSTLDKTKANNEEMKKAHNEMNPVVVHCSPGTGRTGVVIACDIAIREFEQNRLVDVPKIVYKIRRDRASAVQTKEQYRFIYKVVCLYATKLTGGALESI